MATGAPIPDDLRPIVSAVHWLATGLDPADVTGRIGRSFDYLGAAGAAAVVRAAQAAMAAGAAWTAAGPLATPGMAVPAIGGQAEVLVDVRLSFLVGTGASARRQYVTYRDAIPSGWALDDLVQSMLAVAEAWAGEYGSNGAGAAVDVVAVY